MGFVRAIDVSRHQGTIDWAAVAASGVKGAWIKVGGADGGPYTDPMANTNINLASGIGLPWGTYYFASPAIGAGGAQARHAISCGLGAGTLWPALDLEWHNGLTGTQLDAFALDFLAEVEHATGRTPIVYTGAWIGNAATGYFGADSRLGRYPLWIANYGRINTPGIEPPTWEPAVPVAWQSRGWSAWQHNSVTRVPGITANTCDIDAVTESFWGSMTGAPIEEEWLMRPIIISGEAAQWRLVDDANGVLRRQHIDSLELVNILDAAEVLRNDPVILTDPTEIDRFRRIPETGTTIAEWGLINVVAKGVASVQGSIAAIPGGSETPLDEDELADRIARHIGEHLRE